MATENYNHARRNKGTINRKEVAQKVKELFMSELDLEESSLAREAKFG